MLKSPEKRRLGALRMAAWLAASLPALATPSLAASCDSQCLNGVMSDYLAHLTRHDPAGLKLSPSLNARENAKPVPPGQGVWQQVAKIRSQQVFADPLESQIVSYGTVETASGALAVMFVRLKVQNGAIAESEIVFNEKENAFSKPSNLLEPDLIYPAPVPAARRSTRPELIGIVNKYIDAISSHDPSQVPFGPRCDRYASGAKVTNSPDHPAEKEGGTCGGALQHLTGQPVVNLRFTAIDENLGVVAVAFIIPHHERKVPGGTYVSELFKIVDGKIRSIEEFSFGGAFPPDSGFMADTETGTHDIKPAMNMHPSPEFLAKVLSGPPPVATIDHAGLAGSASLQVSSTTFGTAHQFPIANTGWGQSISPQVSWSAGPAGTRSYIVMMEDGTAHGGKNTDFGVLHWLLFNIPASVTSLAEGARAAPDGAVRGGNIQDTPLGYTGPHAPAGAPAFHYHVQVFAIDRTLSLPQGATRDAVIAAIKGHVLASGQIQATYQGPVV